ncbi:MAG: anhydro-N-acetylmuramic acid kinase [Alphaproteobacteria bacterium]
MRAIGLMSGTSLDGVDAAMLVTDGHEVQAFGPALTVPYEPAMRARLRAVLAGQGPVLQVEREVTLHHVDAVFALLSRAGMDAGAVDLIGFHGQTVLHRPESRLTWQIGDGDLLARKTGIDVVCDFRAADVAAGGQGAPLVPIYHAALAHGLARPLAVLNLGGVGNVTWIGEAGELIAFDTGPGNALIDDWALRHTGRPVDHDGALARAGTVDEEVLAELADHAYFLRPPPKSLDRDDFALARLQRTLVRGAAMRRAALERLVAGHVRPEDGAATLTAFTALAVARALEHLPVPPTLWLVCGGGRHNPELMAALRRRLEAPVEPVESVGWDGDALEAQAFAFLAVRSLRGLPLTFPGTTGSPRPLTGGVLRTV